MLETGCLHCQKSDKLFTTFKMFVCVNTCCEIYLLYLLLIILWLLVTSNIHHVHISFVHRNRDITHPPKGGDGTKQQPYKPSVRKQFARALLLCCIVTNMDSRPLCLCMFSLFLYCLGTRFTKNIRKLFKCCAKVCPSSTYHKYMVSGTRTNFVNLSLWQSHWFSQPFLKLKI